ncbi:hypothetical protein QTP88_019393 [Uroleucon formosanum]
MSKLSDDNILELLNGISDRQAIDSDFGGDSDAEDTPCFERKSIGQKNRTMNTFIHGQTSYYTSSPPHSNTSCDESSISNSSLNISKLSRLKPKRPKSAVNSDVSLQDPDIEFDDKPINTDNVDLLINFIENSDSEDDFDIENDVFHFSKDPPFTTLTYNTFNFNEPYGLNVFVDTKSSLQNFEIFFSDFYQHIVDQSNLYSQQCGKNLNLNVDELKAFLGILIIMGFNKLPSIRIYWSADENFYNPRIANVMTQKRFLNILRYIHLNDNSVMPQRGSPTFDKLYKIRPMIDYLNDAFAKHFSPDKHLSCDESMVVFKGRSEIKQYMPMKPVKRVFKIWALCCSTTGYLLKFMVYEGKKESNEKGSLGEKTVLEMTSNYQEKGYCIFFDRFFSSIDLVSKLLNRKIFSCGTMMQNRKYFPKSILKPDKGLKLGEYDFATSGEISVFKWMDRGKKPVVTVSTIHRGEDTAFVKRKNNVGVREEVQCPLSIAEYNKYMGGVDHFDQLQERYNIAWKSRRWWLKLFYHFCDATIVNAYIMHTTGAKLNKIRPLNQLLYRSTLANELIGQFSSRKTVVSNKNIPSTKRKPKETGDGRIILPGNNSRLQNVGKHLPIAGKYNRCRLCSTKKDVKRSKIHCNECKCALCLECFIPFHSP